MKTHKYLGLDVHQVDTQIAIAEAGREGEVRLYGTLDSGSKCDMQSRWLIGN